MPPQGAWMKVGCEQLIQTMPARSRRATRSARSRSADITAAARPKRVSLARRRASVLVSEGAHREHRAEDLLAPDLGVDRDVDEDRRLEEVPARQMPAGRPPPVSSGIRRLARALDEAEHLLVLAARDQRAEQRAVGETVADRDPARLLGEAVEQARRERLLDQQPRGRAADLPLVPEDAEHHPLDRGLDVGVGEDDERRLAAELERDVLDRPAPPRPSPCARSAPSR